DLLLILRGKKESGERNGKEIAEKGTQASHSPNPATQVSKHTIEPVCFNHCFFQLGL
ncbi:hypothetical protein L195_g059116, partial [Trifolium pratense]